MDKGLETLYHKLTNLLHTNAAAAASSSSSSNASAVPEPNTILPIPTFFDRIIPSAAASQNSDRRRSSTRVSRQISITTNDERLTNKSPKTTPMNMTKQKQ